MVLLDAFVVIGVAGGVAVASLVVADAVVSIVVAASYCCCRWLLPCL